jgi:large subunit ribosomal protein L5
MEMPRLREKYLNEVVPALREKFGYKNIMQVPKVEKVVVNMGVSDAVSDPKALDASANDLAQITGQKPLITRAKRSIAAFKLRAGVPIGCKVTLRGARMYYFLDKLFNAALPRIRDFRGVSPKGFDGRGNYTVGLKEQLVFPEIVYDKVDKIRGMDITIVTTAQTDEEGLELLRALGLPVRMQ